MLRLFIVSSLVASHQSGIFIISSRASHRRPPFHPAPWLGTASQRYLDATFQCIASSSVLCNCIVICPQISGVSLAVTFICNGMTKLDSILTSFPPCARTSTTCSCLHRHRYRHRYRLHRHRYPPLSTPSIRITSLISDASFVFCLQSPSSNQTPESKSSGLSPGATGQITYSVAIGFIIPTLSRPCSRNRYLRSCRSFPRWNCFFTHQESQTSTRIKRSLSHASRLSAVFALFYFSWTRYLPKCLPEAVVISLDAVADNKSLKWPTPKYVQSAMS